MSSGAEIVLYNFHFDNSRLFFVEVFIYFPSLPLYSRLEIVDEDQGMVDGLLPTFQRSKLGTVG